MKNVKVNHANLKSMTVSVVSFVVCMTCGLIIALPLAFREQDRAFEEEKFAG